MGQLMTVACVIAATVVTVGVLSLLFAKSKWLMTILRVASLLYVPFALFGVMHLIQLLTGGELSALDVLAADGVVGQILLLVLAGAVAVFVLVVLASRPKPEFTEGQ